MVLGLWVWLWFRSRTVPRSHRSVRPSATDLFSTIRRHRPEAADLRHAVFRLSKLNFRAVDHEMTASALATKMVVSATPTIGGQSSTTVRSDSRSARRRRGHVRGRNVGRMPGGTPAGISSR